MSNLSFASIPSSYYKPTATKVVGAESMNIISKTQEAELYSDEHDKMYLSTLLT